MSLLWTKWFFPDWSNDPGLRASSLAARGLWMDMLCIAAQHDPPGFIAINGNGADVDTLARLVGASPQVVEPLIAELERNGVFSRNRAGMIYSRRMVRDVKRMKTAQKNGKLGGNPTLCSDGRNPRSDNHPDKPPDKAHKPIFQESKNPRSSPQSPPKGGGRSARGSMASAARRLETKTLADPPMPEQHQQGAQHEREKRA